MRKRVLPLLEVLLKPNSSALTKRTSRSRPVNETRAVIILRERLVAKPFSNDVFGEALRVRSELEELLGAERMKETERAARAQRERVARAQRRAAGGGTSSQTILLEDSDEDA